MHKVNVPFTYKKIPSNVKIYYFYSVYHFSFIRKNISRFIIMKKSQAMNVNYKKEGVTLVMPLSPLRRYYMRYKSDK